ncbi:MAG: NAD(P)H-dependent oxidoreductase subunit E, partial [Thermodesulfobacteriota bacterium]
LNATLETVNCVGACALGPVVVVDGESKGKLNPQRAERLLKQIEPEAAPKETEAKTSPAKAKKKTSAPKKKAPARKAASAAKKATKTKTKSPAKKPAKGTSKKRTAKKARR